MYPTCTLRATHMYLVQQRQMGQVSINWSAVLAFVFAGCVRGAFSIRVYMCPTCMLCARANSLGAMARAKKSDGQLRARCSTAAQNFCSHFFRQLATSISTSGFILRCTTQTTPSPSSAKYGVCSKHHSATNL